MEKIIICRGLPGSGRTEWSKKYARDCGAIRICRSDLRRMISTGYSIDLEHLLVGMENEFIIEAQYSGRDVVIDGNFLNDNAIKGIKNILKTLPSDKYNEAWKSVVIKDFPMSLEDALSYDRNREDPLGDAKIITLWNTHQKKIINDIS